MKLNLLVCLIAVAQCGSICHSASAKATRAVTPQMHYDTRLAPALGDALRRENAADFKALLDQGADPNTRLLDDNAIPREKPTPILVTASGLDIKIVKLLLDAGANPNLTQEKGSSTALMMAASVGNLPICQILVSRGANINAQDGNGYTPLLEAAHFGKTQVAEFLVSKGAFLYAIDKKTYMTPLMEAAYGGCWEIFRVLFAVGANLKYKNAMGRTPLMEAATTVSPETAADVRGKIKIVKLLLAQGVDVNAHDLNGQTAAMNVLASPVFGDDSAPGSDAAAANLEILKILVSRGANIDARDSEGKSLFLQAARYGNTDIVKYLLTKGVDVNQRDDDGKTALMLASVNSHENTINALLKSGAKVTLQNYHGEVALP